MCCMVWHCVALLLWHCIRPRQARLERCVLVAIACGHCRATGCPALKPASSSRAPHRRQSAAAAGRRPRYVHSQPLSRTPLCFACCCLLLVGGRRCSRPLRVYVCMSGRGAHWAAHGRVRCRLPARLAGVQRLRQRVLPRHAGVCEVSAARSEAGHDRDTGHHLCCRRCVSRVHRSLWSFR